MLFRIHIAVARVLQSEFWRSIPECERESYDAVATTFGVNAGSAQEAIQIATRAASEAENRNGEYIGGIPIEVNCRCVDRGQFDGYEKHFINPIERPGIFYVSGTTSYGILKGLAADIEPKLEEIRKHIEEFGPPKPSFVHPQLTNEPTKQVRLLCSVCDHWVEVTNEGLIFSFMEGLGCFSLEKDELRRQRSVAGDFFRSHIENCKGNIVAVHEGDSRWDALDESKRDSDRS